MSMGCQCVAHGDGLKVDMEEIKVLAKPLTDFVNKQDPYLSVTVRQGQIVITRDEMVVNTEVLD